MRQPERSLPGVADASLGQEKSAPDQPWCHIVAADRGTIVRQPILELIVEGTREDLDAGRARRPFGCSTWSSRSSTGSVTSRRPQPIRPAWPNRAGSTNASGFVRRSNWPLS
jgi:hypothetical protein